MSTVTDADIVNVRPRRGRPPLLENARTKSIIVRVREGTEFIGGLLYDSDAMEGWSQP